MSRRISIWGSSKERSNPTTRTPRIQIPTFKTPQEYEAEKRKQQHENPSEARPEQDPQYQAPSSEEPKTTQTISRKKRRGYSISICVSEEEENILRKAASDEGMSFSGWARHNLFKAAGKKIPKRHK